MFEFNHTELHDNYKGIIASSHNGQVFACIQPDNTLMLCNTLSIQVEYNDYILYELLTNSCLERSNALFKLKSLNNVKQIIYTFIGFVILLDDGHVFMLMPIISSWKDFTENIIKHLIQILETEQTIQNIQGSFDCFALHSNTNNLYVFFYNISGKIEDHPPNYSKEFLSDSSENSIEIERIGGFTYIPQVKLYTLSLRFIIILLTNQELYVCTQYNTVKLPWAYHNIKNICMLPENMYVILHTTPYPISLYDFSDGVLGAFKSHNYLIDSKIKSIENIKCIVYNNGMTCMLLENNDIYFIVDDFFVRTNVCLDDNAYIRQLKWSDKLENFVPIKAKDADTDIICFGNTRGGCYAVYSNGDVWLSEKLYKLHLVIPNNFTKLYYFFDKVAYVDAVHTMQFINCFKDNILPDLDAVNIKFETSGSYI